MLEGVQQRGSTPPHAGVASYPEATIQWERGECWEVIPRYLDLGPRLHHDGCVVLEKTLKLSEPHGLHYKHSFQQELPPLGIYGYE